MYSRNKSSEYPYDYWSAALLTFCILMQEAASKPITSPRHLICAAHQAVRTFLCLMALSYAANAQAPDTEDPLVEAERIAPRDAAGSLKISTAVLATAREAGSRPREAAALRLIAIAHYLRADFTRSLENAVAAEALYRELGDQRKQSSLLSLMGAIHGSSKQFDRALEVYERALALSREAGALGGEAIVLMNLGKTHFDLGNYDQAVARYEAALAQFEAITAAGDPPRPDAVLFARMGIADAQMRRGELDDAIERAEVVLADASPADIVYQNALAILGEAHLLRGELDSAEGYLTRAREEADRTQRPTKQVETLNLLARLEEARGNVATALELQRTVSALNLDIYTERNSEELARLQSRYESDLQAQQIALQSAKLEKSRSTLVAVSVFAIAALMLAAISFQLFRVTRRSQSSLRVLAETDSLTGLHNRHKMYAFLADVAASDDATKSLCLIDIDNFKTVNDQHGHAVGDALLVGVAKALMAAVRDGDKVARWGGEEFLVLLAGRAHTEAVVAAERLRHRIAAVSVPAASGEPISATASIGIAGFRPDTSDNEMIRRADAAMYQAKLAGKNRVMTWREVAALADTG